MKVRTRCKYRNLTSPAAYCGRVVEEVAVSCNSNEIKRKYVHTQYHRNKL